MVGWIVFAIAMAILVGVMVVLYRKASKAQDEQAEQLEKINEAAVPTTMLIIDKKRMKFKDGGFNQFVMAQVPKRTLNAKVPVVKAKVGPKVASFRADEDVFDEIPVKAQIKAMVSGIYIVSINNYHKVPVPEPEKKGMLAKLRSRTNTAVQQRYADNQKKKADSKDK